MPDLPTTRQRRLPKVFNGKTSWYYGGSLALLKQGPLDISGTQKTVSEGHPISRLGKTDEDLGGDFYTYKSEVVHVSHPHINTVGPGFGTWRYEGCAVPVGTAPLKEHELDLRSRATLEALGTTAVSRCSPVNSHAELLTAVSETLKDGIPVPGIPFWKDKTSIARGAGSEYLNAQFGWIPLLNDIRDTTRTMKNAAKLIDQFQRDAGRNVRRRYEFPKETLTEVVKDTGVIPNGAAYLRTAGYQLPTYFYYNGDESGRYQHIRETERKVWFSGAFTYHMPASDTQVGAIVRAIQEWDYLFGGVPTPDVIWNLTPWSWATDWVANTGDFLTNVSNAMLYGQVMRYGYLMEKTTIKDRRYLDLTAFSGGKRFESVVKTTVKRRIRANPFGFGVTYDGLDAYQMSILAALGITRGSRHAQR